MKFVIILLLSTTGVEEIKLRSHDSKTFTTTLPCEEIVKVWSEVNTKYQEGVNQGHFTQDGKLMIGYICE
tara:strand:+ start:73 stop:282 length:210 start_codon:yes stop_codon:yes gene_type:complete